MAFNTGNPIGSTDPRDFSDNSENLDRAVNNTSSATWTDRFGNTRTSLAGQIGYIGTGVDGAIEDYAAGQELSTFSTIIRYSGEFYRPAAGTALPYTTTPTTPDVDSNLVAVGDAVLRQDLASNAAGSGSDDVAHTGTPDTVTEALDKRTIYVGSVAELEALPSPLSGQQAIVKGSPFTWDGTEWIPDAYVTVAAFGADPDAADNTQALRDAIESGYPIDWGNEEYQVQGRVGADSTISHAIDWISNGAKVTLDAAVAHQPDVIAYRVSPLDHKIVGQLTIEANLKANRCFGIRNTAAINYPSSFGTFYAKGLKVSGAKRDTDGFRGGVGMSVEGCFFWVVLDNPSAKNCVLGTGGGIQGSVGISGIDIVRDGISGGYALYVEINNPDINGIESEDLTYEFDQDGIKIFGANTAGSLYSTFQVNGGTFRDCFGRSVKSQSPTGTVKGSHFIRRRGFTSGVGNEEISFQGGMGFVENISVDYDGFVPSAVVSQRSTDINRAQGKIDGVTYKVANATLSCVVSTFSEPPMAPVVATNISGTGTLEYVSKIRTPQDISHHYLSNVEAEEITEGLVQCTTGGTNINPADYVYVEAKNCINKGAAVRAVHQKISGVSVPALLNAERVVGFFGSDTGGANAPEVNGPAIAKVLEKIGFSQDPSETSLTPLIRAETRVIAAGATADFSLKGQGIAIVNSNISQTTQGMFSFSDVSGGRFVDIFEPADISIGASAKPASGTLIVWPDTVNTITKVENNDASSRVVSIIFIGNL